MKTWLTVPSDLEPLRLEGLELLKRVPRRDHLAIHWGMVMAVYPFWAGVAVQVGRLLRLQGSAAASHVQRRIREQYGERETVSRAARRVLASFRDWGVLNNGALKGLYAQGLCIEIKDPTVVSWLIEASLHARSSSAAALKELLENPALFPFRIERGSAESILSVSPRIEMVRHGLDELVVILRKRRGEI